ncbi:MAG: flavin reductase family protein [Thermoplasmata archaeon]|nr:flavin reductase family protein [Thermoplasmata archaeon]
MSTSDDSPEFRRAMARWPTGVSVVTTRADGQDSGLTVNALVSISLHPPLVLVSLTLDAASTPLIDRSGRFAVNFLAADQRALSERFALAVPAEQKFLEVPMHRGLGDVPLLDGAVTYLECRVRSAENVEDHRLFIGAVERLGPVREVPPLLFYHSQYGVQGMDGEVRLPHGPEGGPPASNPRRPS